MKRTIYAFLLIFTINLLSYSQNKWKLGIFNIESYDKIGSSIANSIKKSSLLILSREFNTYDINTNSTSREFTLKNSIKEKIDFSIYGLIIQINDKEYKLVLQLIDVANAEIKLSRTYKFEYDPEKIFETIDSVVVDFSKGVNEQLPQYDENLAEEYRKIIEQRTTNVNVPGKFLLGASATFSFYDIGISSLHLGITFKYLNNSSGGIFNEGWFANINFPDIVSRISLSTTNISDIFIGKEISASVGSKIFDFIGVGIDFLLLRQTIKKGFQEAEIHTKTLAFILRPLLYFNIEPLNIFLTLTQLSDYEFSTSISIIPQTIQEEYKYTSLKLIGNYKITKDIFLENNLLIERLEIREKSFSTPVRYSTTINTSVEISVYKSFSF
ncbi:MAG: hypothetical protein N2712_06675 [Brevinematales bacterium]|nr:hypothetical protein [Brevinematales bacterium]